jgi:hypothetical protein
VQFQRRARNIFFLGGGDEIAKMAQLHADSSMLIGYSKARNMVFHGIQFAR